MEIDEKFGKIVNLAKRGEGGEKENAIEIVKRICAERGLDFETVMTDAPPKRRFSIECGKKLFQLCLQVVLRYGLDKLEDVEGITSDENKSGVAFTTTETMYLEACYAFEIMARSYEKERRRTIEAFHIAFLSKHRLYYFGEGWQEFNKSVEKDITLEKMLELERAATLARVLEDVSIKKALPMPVDNTGKIA